MSTSLTDLNSTLEETATPLSSSLPALADKILTDESSLFRLAVPLATPPTALVHVPRSSTSTASQAPGSKGQSCTPPPLSSASGLLPWIAQGLVSRALFRIDWLLTGRRCRPTCPASGAEDLPGHWPRGWRGVCTGMCECLATGKATRGGDCVWDVSVSESLSIISKSR